MLIEVATEQTHFIKPSGQISNLDTIQLMLPPFLEERRVEIEQKLKEAY